MQRPIATPKRNIGSLHSLAEIGALSSANTQFQGSTPIFTRPVAHVALPTTPQNASQFSQAPNLSNTPIAHPVGVSGPSLNQLQAAFSSGPTAIGGSAAHVSHPTNYPLRAEE